MASPRILAGTAAETPPTLWDPVVRVTHWGIAASVLLNALLDEGGSVLHVTIGWIVMALLFLRMVWGCSVRSRPGSRPFRRTRWRLCAICASWRQAGYGTTPRTTRPGP